MKQIITIVLFFLFCNLKASNLNQLDFDYCSCDSSIIISNNTSIEGYSDRISYFPEDTIKIHVSSILKQLNIKLIAQTLLPVEILSIDTNNGIVQNYHQCSYRDGCNWETTHKIVIPKGIDAGYFTINLSNDSGSFKIPIIVKSIIKKDILCVASTNTWHAYNDWGGASFYRYNINDSCILKKYSDQLSVKRPLKVVDDLKYKGHMFDAELGLIHWLESQNYKFDLVTDEEIDKNPDLLQNYKIVLLNTHSEYWTENALIGLDEFIANKGALCHLGANSLYWKATLKDDYIECQKKGGLHKSDSTKGGLWRNLNRPEEKVIGGAFDRAGYNTFMPYVVINSDHWLFENTDLKNGDLFGKSLNRGYASGHETDKLTAFTPLNTILLARGVNQEAKDELGVEGANRNGGAAMVFIEQPGGGYVFSSGSITSGGSMLVDTSMSIIVSNFIKKALLQNK